MMFSRLSSLLVYVVAGLVISAVATPMGPDYNDEPKTRLSGPSYPQSYSPRPKYPQEKPYPKPYSHTDKAYVPRDSEDKSYPEAKKYLEQKKYPEQKKEEKPFPKPHPENKKYLKSDDDKDHDNDRKDHDNDRKDKDNDRKDYDNDRKDNDRKDKDNDRKDKDNDRKDYDGDRKDKDNDRGRKHHDNYRKGDDDKDYESDYDHGRHGNSYDDKDGGCANVEEQHCCDQVNNIKQAESSNILAILSFVIPSDFNGLIGKNCSPVWAIGGSGQCKASTVCCKNAKFEGVFAVGCTNVNVF